MFDIDKTWNDLSNRQQGILLDLWDRPLGLHMDEVHEYDAEVLADAGLISRGKVTDAWFLTPYGSQLTRECRRRLEQVDDYSPIEYLRREVAEKNAALDELQQRYEAEKRSGAAARTSNRSLAEENVNYVRVKRDLEKRLAEAEATCDAWKVEASNTQERLTGCRNANTALRQRARLAEAQVRQLTEALEATCGDRVAWRNKFERLQAIHDGTEGENYALRQRYAAAQAAVQGTLDDNSRLRDRIGELEQEVKRLDALKQETADVLAELTFVVQQRDNLLSIYQRFLLPIFGNLPPVSKSDGELPVILDRNGNTLLTLWAAYAVRQGFAAVAALAKKNASEEA